MERVEAIGFEVGVLLPPDDKEFDYYSCNNEYLPFGFYDENQGLVETEQLETEKNYVKNYVLNGVEGTYGIISDQGFVDALNMDDTGEIDYGFFKDKNLVLYSVCKKDGKLVEGFLETELDKLARLQEAYSVYRQEWYSDHGVSEADVHALQQEYEHDVSQEDFEGSFEDYELEYGYHGGEVYVCFDEFLDNEYEETQECLDNVIEDAALASAETETPPGREVVNNSFEK